MHIRKGDQVEVITGDDAERGVARCVLRVLRDRNKVVVEGVNRVYKHLKPDRRNPQGGRLSKEMPIAVSNVLLYCPTCRRGVRLGHRYDAEGRIRTSGVKVFYDQFESADLWENLNRHLSDVFKNEAHYGKRNGWYLGKKGRNC